MVRDTKRSCSDPFTARNSFATLPYPHHLQRKIGASKRQQRLTTEKVKPGPVGACKSLLERQQLPWMDHSGLAQCSRLRPCLCSVKCVCLFGRWEDIGHIVQLWIGSLSCDGGKSESKFRSQRDEQPLFTEATESVWASSRLPGPDTDHAHRCSPWPNYSRAAVPTSSTQRRRTGRSTMHRADGEPLQHDPSFPVWTAHYSCRFVHGERTKTGPQTETT
jgi:hypothetical protein